MSESESGGSRTQFIISALLGCIIVLRVLWSGVVYPESNAVILILAASLLGLAILIHTKRGEWRIGGTDSLAVLYFIVILCLYLTSSKRWLARDFLYNTGSCTAAYLLASHLVRSRRQGAPLVGGLLAAGLLVSLYALYQYLWGLGETRAIAALRARGDYAFASRLFSTAVCSTFFSPNALAGFLIIVIPVPVALLFISGDYSCRVSRIACAGVVVIAALAWPCYADLSSKPVLFAILAISLCLLAAGMERARRKGRPVLQAFLTAPLAVIPLIALSLTASEGAWFALAISCTAGILISRRKSVIALLIALAMIAAVLTATSGDGFPGGLKASFEARWGYWAAALEMWRESPVVGLGPGTFAGAYPRFRTPESEEGRMPHNMYLGLAAETGVVGLAAFLLIWFSFVAALIRGAEIGDRISSAAFVSAGAFLLHGAIDAGISDPAIAFTAWTVAGFGAGAAREERSFWRIPRAMRALFAILIFCAVLFNILPQAAARRSLLLSRSYESLGVKENARAGILKAISIEPDNATYWEALGGMHAREGRDDLAEGAYMKAALYGEGIPLYHFRLATCLWRLSAETDTTGAIDEMKRAIAHNPHDVDYRLLLAHWLEKRGDARAALLEYRRAAQLIAAALSAPRMIRRHSVDEYERLGGMVRDRIAELERAAGKKI